MPGLTLGPAPKLKGGSMPYVKPEQETMIFEETFKVDCNFCARPVDVPASRAQEAAFCSQKCFRARYGLGESEARR